jgi:UDP-2,3-diacylglucosamine hydrolase
VAKRAAMLSEIELAPGALAIGDLHLDASRADDARAFERFLDDARDAPALVILGDLFEAWVGPAHAELAGARAVLDALARWTSRGAKLEFVPGNRDFLLGEDFERATRARVHARGFVGRSSGARILFVHGDELCTLDRGYQRLKSVLRSAPIGWIAPRVPRNLSLALARRLRTASVRAVASKPPAEKEQQAGEARRLAVLHGASAIVCGHAHRFRDEALEGGVRWIVLDAFGGERDLARVGEAGRIDARSSSPNPST